MAKRNLQLSKIRLDGNTQPRVELEESLIAEYKEAYLAKAEMPPLEVMFDGASYWLWDGFHRRWGAERAGLEKLPCNVTNGTREDAQWASYGANVTHGLRRTNADKTKAVKAALKHPKGPGTTDSKLAEHCGVDHKTVLKYRKELESAWEIPKVTTREGKDGKTYDTTNIGSKPRKPPAEPVEPDDEPEVYDDPDPDTSGGDQQVSSADLTEGGPAVAGVDFDEPEEPEDEPTADGTEPHHAVEFAGRLRRWCRAQLDNLDLTPDQMSTVMEQVTKEVREW
jgi:hypothetical protein